MKILHCGAGKIGRGLIYPYLMGRHEVYMVDSNINLVKNIRDNGGYRVFEVDYDDTSILEIKNPRIISFTDLENIKDFDIITTSVITVNLPDIVSKIAKVLKQNNKSVYIVPMENSSDAVEIIRNEIEKYSIPDSRVIRVLGSVIDRIVPTLGSGIDVECEKYRSIIVEYDEGLELLSDGSIPMKRNIAMEFDKKFFIVNGLHACSAYLGFAKGYKYIYEIMEDKKIRSQLEALAVCYIKYLTANYKFLEKDLEFYVENTLYRFSNPSLRDHVIRVGRNLLVKMALDGRIYRPYFFNMNQGLPYRPFIEVIKASKLFDIGNDYKEYLSCCSKREGGISASNNQRIKQ